MTVRLQFGRMGSICRKVSVSRLFAFFVALSLLFGPLAMDRAMAGAPSSDHAQKVMDEHCDPAEDGQADKAESKSCCGAMCAAAAVVVPLVATSAPMFDRLAASTALKCFHRGVLSEISTPPPRLA